MPSALAVTILPFRGLPAKSFILKSRVLPGEAPTLTARSLKHCGASDILSTAEATSLPHLVPARAGRLRSSSRSAPSKSRILNFAPARAIVAL